jgi:hypothetical protein
MSWGLEAPGLSPQKRAKGTFQCGLGRCVVADWGTWAVG